MKRYVWLVFPLFYFLLTALFTFPLILHLPTYVADFGDPLLNTWALAWGQHALLHPWYSVDSLFNANAFYPYPHSLAFSEHLLLYAAQLLPLRVFNLGPVFIHNGGVFFSLAIAGWGMALLVTHWTKNRWAGLTAGLIFAFIPARLNHWAHLHQLSVQWLPFVILYLDYWLTRRRWLDATLLAIFLNLQLLSAINYIPQTLILTALFGSVWIFRTPVWAKIRSLLPGALLLMTVTALLNFPVVKIYFDLSELHGFERTLGDAAIFGAALTDYALPPPENSLYGGWLTARMADSARPLIPLFLGIVPVILAIAGLTDLKRKSAVTLFLGVLTLLAMVLSFGANNLALGQTLAPLTGRLALYRWLFEYVPGFSGLRVPARMAILTFFGVSALAGLGITRLPSRRVIPLLAMALITAEFLPLPLPGIHAPTQSEMPPIYHHLTENPTGKVVLELPYDLTRRGPAEMKRLYFSAFGWYELVNGASGFNPAGLQDLSVQLERFPNANTLDILRQLKITHLILHSAEYPPEEWNRIWAALPAFLPSVADAARFGDDYLLILSPPRCPVDALPIAVQLIPQPPNLDIALTNHGTAAYAGLPQTVNLLQADNRHRRFLEPLFVPAGQTRRVKNIMPIPIDYGETVSLGLPEIPFNQRLAPGELEISAPFEIPDKFGVEPDTSLAIQFGNAQLVGFTLAGRDASACRVVNLRLFWDDDSRPNVNNRVTARLVDRFGNVINDHTTFPWQNQSVLADDHRLPILDTLPTGQYGVSVSVFGADGAAYPPANTGTLFATDQMVLLSDVLVRPPENAGPGGEPIGTFANGLTLLGFAVNQTELGPGDMLRLTLYWQTELKFDENFTVFTQLLTPDGQVVGQFDNPPRGGTYPAALWQPGKVVSDDYLLALAPGVSTDRVQLAVGIYNSATQERIFLAGNQTDYLSLMALPVVKGQ